MVVGDVSGDFLWHFDLKIGLVEEIYFGRHCCHRYCRRRLLLLLLALLLLC